MSDDMFSLVIPAYNEEKNILRTLTTYYSALREKTKKFEVIIVCDGCTDKTPEISKKFKSNRDNVKVLLFPERLGKGGAVLAGFREARGDIIGFTDADSSTSAKEFMKIIEALPDCDFAVGSRTMHESRILVRQPVVRRILAWGFIFYVNFLFGLWMRDTQCGAKVFKKHAIKSVINDMKITGFSFDVEIIYKLKRNGFKLKSVPIQWANDLDSKVKMRHVFEMFFSLLKLRLGLI